MKIPAKAREVTSLSLMCNGLVIYRLQCSNEKSVIHLMFLGLELLLGFLLFYRNSSEARWILVVGMYNVQVWLYMCV